MQKQFAVISEEEINSIKRYLVEVSQEYSKYCKECKKRIRLIKYTTIFWGINLIFII